MKLKKTLFTFLAAVILLFPSTFASANVMWGKTELKPGQIGKVTILREIAAIKFKPIREDGPQSPTHALNHDVVKILKPGEEFRVYGVKRLGEALFYDLGGELYVQRSNTIKYETPSKAKLALLESSNPSAKVMWGKTELKPGQIGKVTILRDIGAEIADPAAIRKYRVVKMLKPGEEYRVYGTKRIGEILLYDLGGGLYVQRTNNIKYETPSKAKLALLNN